MGPIAVEDDCLFLQTLASVADQTRPFRLSAANDRLGENSPFEMARFAQMALTGWGGD